MNHHTPDKYQDIRDAVRALCAQFPDEYHRQVDAQRAYPEAFVDALTQAGWLAALIPQDYGGSGLGLAEASVIMEEINRAGGNAGACHGQMYNMGTLLRHGSAEQKQRYLPRIASGELRLQSMGVTEPTTGTDTTKIKTTAVRRGDRYVVNGQKVWISRVQHSDLMILLARTTPLAEVKKKSEGLSIFLVDLKSAIGHGMVVRPIPNMVNHETNELFFENLEIPAEHLIGEEGQGFKYILDGLNAERTLIAAECIGDGYWFIDRVTAYVKDRVVFGRPIGQNQGVQFPIAESYIEVEAANLMRWKACELFDAHQPCGAQANMAKYLAAKASWEAANVCLQTHGGFGFACEYDIERKFRETRLYQVAPISTNLIFSYVAGIRSVMWTDSLQALMMIIASVLVCGLVLIELGGFSGLFSAIKATKPELLQVPGPGLFSFTTFLGLTIPWFFFAISNPQVSQRLYMPASLKARVTRATCSTDTPFFISLSSRSEATSSPPEIATQPLAARASHSSGVKVFSKRTLPHHEMSSLRRCSSSARPHKALGGAASSTKWKPVCPVSCTMASMRSTSVLALACS